MIFLNFCTANEGINQSVTVLHDEGQQNYTDKVTKVTGDGWHWLLPALTDCCVCWIYRLGTEAVMYLYNSKDPGGQPGALQECTVLLPVPALLSLRRCSNTPVSQNRILEPAIVMLSTVLKWHISRQVFCIFFSFIQRVRGVCKSLKCECLVVCP